MKKKLVIIIVALGLGILGYFLLGLGGQMQSRAIQEAKLYHSDEICADVITPAVHTATGARYTFPDSCLAPGWEAATSTSSQ